MLNKKTVYEIITEQIINSLEQDQIPWRKPWSDFGSPKNLLTGKEYSGINFFLLSLSGWQNPYFLTYKQAKKLGGISRRVKNNPRFVGIVLSLKKINQRVRKKVLNACDIMEFST